jgi:hypothetical protein
MYGYVDGVIQLQPIAIGCATFIQLNSITNDDQ